MPLKHHICFSKIISRSGLHLMKILLKACWRQSHSKQMSQWGMAISRKTKPAEDSADRVKSLLMSPAAIGVCLVNQVDFEGLISNTKIHYKTSSVVLLPWNHRIILLEKTHEVITSSNQPNSTESTKHFIRLYFKHSHRVTPPFP